MSRVLGRAAAIGVFMLAAACQSSGAGGREVRITQRDDGCTPARIEAAPGEKLKLSVKNESSKDYEIEGIEGTKLEELLVPAGKTRTPGYTVPAGDGTHKIKCYIPGGASTIIELVVGGGSATAPAASAVATASPSAAATTPAGETADTSVAVTLVDYSVSADKPSVTSGKIRFIATNTSASHVHELALLRTKPDGSFDNVGEIKSIDPEKGGSIVLDLAPGAYQLACLITIGEAGSTVDHYQQGMHTPFTVR